MGSGFPRRPAAAARGRGSAPAGGRMGPFALAPSSPPGVRRGNGRPPLHRPWRGPLRREALRGGRGRTAEVEQLVREAGAEVNRPDDKGWYTGAGQYNPPPPPLSSP